MIGLFKKITEKLKSTPGTKLPNYISICRYRVLASNRNQGEVQRGDPLVEVSNTNKVSKEEYC